MISIRSITLRRIFYQNRLEEGFTLIEILVALVILSMALGVIVASLGTAANSVQSTTERTESVVIARSLLASEGHSIPFQYGEISGSTDGYSWHLLTKPWGTATDISDRPAGAYWIQVQVTRGNRSTVLSTLRVGPIASEN